MTVGEIDTITGGGQEELYRLVQGHYTTKALLSLWRTGLLERASAGEELDVAAMAAAGFELDLLRSVLDYLVVRGHFETVRPGVYRLSDRGRATSGYYGYLSTMVGGYEPVFTRMEGLLTGELAYGRDVNRSHDELQRGLAALEDRLMGTVVEAAREAGVSKVLDLGCGSAQTLANICAIGPGVRGVGVDRSPKACAIARETAWREGLEGRLTIVEADVREIAQLPPGVTAGVDAVTVMFLLHEILRQEGREGTVRLLGDLARLVGPGGRLIMVEVAGPSEYAYRPDQLFIPEYELMHEFTHQRLAPRASWEAMLGDAGLTVERSAPVDMCQAFCLVAVATRDR